MANVDWTRIASAARETGFTTESTAEETARKMREFEIKKDEILMKFMEAVLPIIDAITPQELADVFEGLAYFVKTYAKDVGDFLSDGLKDIVAYINKMRVLWPQTVEILKKWLHVDETPSARSLGASVGGVISAVSAMPRANGGVVSMPSLIGERGPEAVIPLDYSRSARAGNIMQNITQTFQMSGNETTALSLANVVKTRGFQRALGNASALNARLGR